MGRQRDSPSPGCTGTWDALEELVMWSSMSTTISSAVAICHREPGVSCAGGPGLGPACTGEATYLYPAHASLPMDPCGQTQALLTHSEPGDSLSMFCSRIF